MLSRYIRQVLGAQNSQVVANQFSCILRINDIVDKSSLGSYQWVGETLGVLRSVLFHVLTIFIQNQSNNDILWGQGEK